VRNVGRYRVGTLVGYFLSIVCIAALTARVDWGLFYADFKDADLFALLFAIPPLVITYAFFAFRWRILLTFVPRPSFVAVFSILMAGYATNALLPMRAGDALRVALVRRKYGHGAARALSSILVERVFDLLALLVFGIVVAVGGKLPSDIIDILRIATLVVAALIATLIMVTIHIETAARVLQTITRPLGARIEKEAVFHVRQFAEALDETFPRKRGSVNRLVWVIGLSMLGWGSFGTAMIICTAAFGVEPAVEAGLLLMVITNLGSAIPSSPASIGVYHALGVLALSPWGVQFDLALSVATASHAIATSIQLLLGLLAMVALRRGARSAGVNPTQR
jgi:uncharacterized protein (TIRG00374 family)